MIRDLITYVGGIKEQFPHNESAVYAFDNEDDGSVVYKFNSLGFRGDDPDPEKPTIVVVGHNNALGVGLNIEDSWPWKFKKRYEEHHNCEVNLLNFSQYNASNETISNMVISQLSTLRPVALLVDYNLISFKELFDENGKPFTVTPWDEGETSELYYYMYNPTNAAADTINSMLLVQNFCQAYSIPYVCGWLERANCDEVFDSISTIVSCLSDKVDWKKFCNVSPFDKPVFKDISRDGFSIGAETSTAYAEKLFEKYLQLYN